MLNEETARDVLAEMVKGNAEPMLRAAAVEWALAEIDRLKEAAQNVA